MQPTIYDGFVYVWTNTKNNKKYIGSRRGTIDDGYVGSGKHFRKAYEKDPESFVREILEFVSGDASDVFSAEQRWLDSVPDIANNDSYYNLSPTAGGGRNHDHLSEEERREIYRKWRAGSDKALANMSLTEKKDLARRKREAWHSREDFEAYREKKRMDRIEEEAKMSDEEKAQRAADLKERLAHYKTEDPDKWAEWQKKKVESMAETRRGLKLRYVNREGKRKMVPQNELQMWLDSGWNLGMGPKSDVVPVP